MSTAVYAGSFDPVHNGHTDIIQRASKIFDDVIVLVAVNPNKRYVFTVRQKIDMLEKCISSLNLKNIEVENYGGAIVDYCKKLNHHVIVKGVRNIFDFEHERQQAYFNNHISDNEVETLLLVASPSVCDISSTYVKEIARLNYPIDWLIPECIHKEVMVEFERLLR